MNIIFTFIATVATFVTGLFSTSPKMTVVPFTDADFPQVPTSTDHVTNDFEDTLSFTTADDHTIDVCTILDTPNELTIAVSDEYGNLVAGVNISLATLTSYIQNVAQVPAIA